MPPSTTKNLGAPPNTDKGALVLDLCNRFPDYTHKGLARMLYDEQPAWFRNLESARCCVRYYMGAHGDSGRRRKIKPWLAPELPKAVSDPWQPLLVGKCVAGVMSDLHIPYHDPGAIEASVKHFHEQGVGVILLNGDVLDFYQLSRFDKRPSMPKVRKEIEIGKQFLEWLRVEFPDARIIFKAGNHDERLDKYVAAKAPELYDMRELTLSTVLGLGDLDIEEVPDDSPVMLGGLPVFHGHELPRGISNPVNPARGAFLRLLSTALISHFHQESKHTARRFAGSRVSCWSIGCHCGLSPRYARINQWGHGGAICRVESRKSWQLDTYGIMDGVII